ncbi:MAG: Radical domain protein [Candidatus Acidoferrum typicum]|nr:Radical domain protein [Candidatus Acidoferrum typicum]
MGQLLQSGAIEKAVDSLNHKPLGYRINILIARLCFRGIYFPQMGRFAWLKTILENRSTIFKLIKQGFRGGCTRPYRQSRPSQPQSRTTEASASVKACGLSAQEQALVSFEDIELGDHDVEAGGAVLTAQLRQWPSLPRRHWAFPQKQNRERRLSRDLSRRECV